MGMQITHWKPHHRHVRLGGLDEEVHPEVHELLLGHRLFCSQFHKMLIDRSGRQASLKELSIATTSADGN